MKWTIYCHQHIESGRRYVGLTKLTMLKRWNSHVHSSNRKKGGWSHFANAIRKYGKDAFSHEILEVCSDLEVANLAEESWIELLETRNPEKGFNLAKGGAHTPHPVKNPWDRPEFRDKVVAGMKRKGQDPAWRASVSSGLKLALQDPEIKARMSERARLQSSQPETTAMKRALWGDPNYASRCSNQLVRTAEKLADRNQCERGHPFSLENTKWAERTRKGRSSKYRVCITCRSNSARSRYVPRPRREANRKSHCPHGHSFLNNVLWITRNGRKYQRCKTCALRAQKLSRKKRVVV